MKTRIALEREYALPAQDRETGAAFAASRRRLRERTAGTA
jgi:hypothetical protein